MEMNGAVAALSALAHETRLAIYRHLVAVGHEGQRAGLIAAALELPNGTLSFHLNQLRHAGLVTARRDGRRIVYGADYEAMGELLGYLTENCCGGAAPCLPASRGRADNRRERVA